MSVQTIGRRGWALGLLLAVLAFWGGDPHGRAAREREGKHGERASQALPPALRVAYLAAVQAEGGAAYAVREDEGGLVADNPAQGLRVAFSDQGTNGSPGRAGGFRSVSRSKRLIYWPLTSGL